ncbi:SymE family type I addiction module toxin [Dyadobacter alkalitolerans]|uniref:SymE family type I addiction module toxin n=1 Tax=Dyadobacter alkalitolerans TaxID=492736 RepID=UPI00047C052F|nr:SymE family type I addiction module toxin [Dyadobacter alkalitolerans]
MTHEKKSPPPTDRHLTVYSKHVSRAWHQYVIMPEIRLCGKWLLDAGFECGHEVTVRCFGNKLEITHNQEPESVLNKKRRASRRVVVP